MKRLFHEAVFDEGYDLLAELQCKGRQDTDQRYKVIVLDVFLRLLYIMKLSLFLDGMIVGFLILQVFR